MSAPIAALWRRLDVPGHDGCQFVPGEDGWTLRGSAVFLQDGQVCQLRYEVLADSGFRTREASVTGWIGVKAVEVGIRSDGDGRWTAGGVEQPQLAGCVDVDLGFTPATNFLPIRRLGLEIGGYAPAPAAYLAFPELGLQVLRQSYRRVSDTGYEYEAPDAGYRGTLEFSAQGIVVDYPQLFTLVSAI
ncbi:MAG: putative glycolipid-binding domain-containing protein [Luteimonas sp.]